MFCFDNTALDEEANWVLIYYFMDKRTNDTYWLVALVLVDLLLVETSLLWLLAQRMLAELVEAAEVVEVVEVGLNRQYTLDF